MRHSHRRGTGHRTLAGLGAGAGVLLLVSPAWAQACRTLTQAPIPDAPFTDTVNAMIDDTAAGRATIVDFVGDPPGPSLSALSVLTPSGWAPNVVTGINVSPNGVTIPAVFDRTINRPWAFAGAVAPVGGGFQNDVWVWDGDQRWARPARTSPWPEPVGTAKAAYDPVRGRVILLVPDGGQAGRSQTWEWTGAGFERGPDLVGVDITGAGFIFDEWGGRGFLYASDVGGTLEQVWTYAPGATAAAGAWTRAVIPGPGRSEAMINACLVQDPRRGRIYRLFGRGEAHVGGQQNTTFEWDRAASRWVLLPVALRLPSNKNREAAVAVYCRALDQIVIYGGFRNYFDDVPQLRTEHFHDTWLFTDRSPAIESASAGPVEVCQGGTALLAVAPYGGPYTYQWYKNDQPIPGATGQSFGFLSAQASDAGAYRCVLSNDCGSLSGPVSTLRVDPPITFDAPAFWPGCSTCPGGNSLIVPPTLSAASRAGPELRLHLQKLVTGQWADVQVVTFGDGFTLVNMQRSDAGDYRILIEGNACGPVVESGRHYEVGVAFDAQPSSVTVAPCAPAVFSVRARGTCIRSYQWLRDGVPLADGGRVAGAATPTLTISGCRYEDEGFYACRVTDACESLDSQHARLSLTTPTWKYAAPMDPAPRSVSGHWLGAYDEARGVTVLYGGVQSGGQTANFLWEYDGVSWAARQDAYGGVATNLGQPLFDGLFPPSTPASALVYNPDDRKTYLIAAISWSRPLMVCTWDGASWARPYFGPVNGDTARTHAVYDRLNRRIVIVRSVGGSHSAEMLVYDPATNQMTGPTPMFPQVENGVHDARLIYDERRARCVWYNNLNPFVAPSMWVLNGTAWARLPGDPPLRFGSFTQMVYDPVRWQIATMGGSWDGATWYTATHAWPDDASRWQFTPAPASAWATVLPDGAPRNPAGAGVSPLNNWSPPPFSAMVFDRRRRTMVAPGLDNYSSFSGGPPVTWRVYERRYQDKVELDRPVAAVVRAPGDVVTMHARAGGYATGGLVYQWRKNGAALVNGPTPTGSTVAAAHTSTLTITGVGPGDAGEYACTITGDCGSLTTNAVRLGCAADFNSQNGVDLLDIFAFLQAWFEGCTGPAAPVPTCPRSADYNGLNGVDLLDIFAFLTDWFAGGC